MPTNWRSPTTNGNRKPGNDQLKTHLRGPGKILRSRLPELVQQEIWAYLIVHHAINALIAKASAAADLDPDRLSFAKTLRLIRRTATGTADIPPYDWADALPRHLAMIAALLIPERTCPRAVKRARQNQKPIPSEETRRTGQHPPSRTSHHQPAHPQPPRSMIKLRFVALGHVLTQRANRVEPGSYRFRVPREAAAKSRATSSRYLAPAGNRKADQVVGSDLRE